MIDCWLFICVDRCTIGVMGCALSGALLGSLDWEPLGSPGIYHGTGNAKALYDTGGIMSEPFWESWRRFEGNLMGSSELNPEITHEKVACERHWWCTGWTLMGPWIVSWVGYWIPFVWDFWNSMFRQQVDMFRSQANMFRPHGRPLSLKSRAPMACS